MYGAALLEEGGYTYVYGTEDVRRDGEVPAHREGGDRGRPRGLGVLHGNGLVAGPGRVGAAAEGGRKRLRRGEGQKGILPFHDELADPLQRQPGPVFIDQPRGAVRPADPRDSTPESQDGLFTYDAHVHPEFTDASGLLASYDVNTFDPSELLSNVDSYRPRFIRVRIGR